jgi:hypothetical protein
MSGSLSAATWETAAVGDWTQLPTLEVAVREKYSCFSITFFLWDHCEKRWKSWEQQRIAEGLLPSTSKLS